MPHSILVAGRLLQHSHGPTGVIPIASFRIFLAELEAALDRDPELKQNSERLVNDRTDHGYPKGLGQF